MIQVVATQKAPKAIGPYSQAIEVNGMVYTSGQIGLTLQGEVVGDIYVQTRQVLNNLKAVLEAGNSSLDRVVKTTIFLLIITHLGLSIPRK